MKISVSRPQFILAGLFPVVFARLSIAPSQGWAMENVPQDDPWDSKKDMALALLDALLAMSVSRLARFSLPHGNRKPESTGEPSMNQEHRFQSCIAACSSCATACESCMAICLSEERAASLTRCIQLCRDCADLCRLGATLMIRESEYASALCRLCHVACTDCGEECSIQPGNHCHECARACQGCAEECELMAACVPNTGETTMDNDDPNSTDDPIINDPGNEDPGSQVERQEPPGLVPDVPPLGDPAPRREEDDKERRQTD